MRTILSVWMLCVFMLGCEDEDASHSVRGVTGLPDWATCSQGQIYGNAQHTGVQCASVPTLRVLDRVIQDPATAQENEDLGFVGVHYGSALTGQDGTVYVPTKEGYTTLFEKGSQTWGVQALRWNGKKLAPVWSTSSRWKPFDAINPFGTTAGYESLFQPALTRFTLDMPMDAGRIARLSRATGELVAMINPLAGTPFDGDQATIVNSALTVGPDDSLYYTVVAWDPSGAIGTSPRESWLVRVTPSNAVTLVPWGQVTALPGVTQQFDSCFYTFNNASPRPARPWPPSPTSVPPLFGCGKQRPPINGAPAITADGKVIMMTSNNNAITYAYLVAYDFATAAPAWFASARGHILDGCGGKVPFNDSSNADPSICRFGANVGVDLLTNQPVAGRMTSLLKGAPVVAPDGSVYVSTYSGAYDNNQGHLHRFSATGAFLNVLDYGFGQTPAIRATGAGPLDYELAMDFNNFSPETGDGTGAGLDASVARVTPDLQIINRGRVPANPAAYSNDFVDDQAAVDTAGNAYTINATGDVYKLAPDGSVLASVNLGLPSYSTLGSALTWGVDRLGRSALYVSFGGVMHVIGQ